MSPGERKSEILELIQRNLTYDAFMDVLWRYMDLSELEYLLDYLVRYEYIDYCNAYPDDVDCNDEWMEGGE